MDPSVTPSIQLRSPVSETGSCYAAQAGLELAILLPRPPQCWEKNIFLSGFQDTLEAISASPSVVAVLHRG